VVLRFNQPAKLAAMEGHYEKSGHQQIYIFSVGGGGNNEPKSKQVLKLPGGLSFLYIRILMNPITGLNGFQKNDRPGQVNAVFSIFIISWFRILHVAIGLTLYASFLWWRGIRY